MQFHVSRRICSPMYNLEAIARPVSELRNLFGDSRGSPLDLPSSSRLKFAGWRGQKSSIFLLNPVHTEQGTRRGERVRRSGLAVEEKEELGGVESEEETSARRLQGNYSRGRVWTASLLRLLVSFGLVPPHPPPSTSEIPWVRLGAVVIHAQGMMDAPDAHAASRRPTRRRSSLTIAHENVSGKPISRTRPTRRDDYYSSFKVG